MDLILCRNLLIYLKSDLQMQVLNTLHYSLKTGGLLFLGHAESLAGQDELFHPQDTTHRVFKALESGRKTRVSRGLPVDFKRLLDSRTRLHDGSSEAHLPPALFERLGVTLIVFDAQNQIVETFGHPDRFLAFRAGLPDHDLLSLARDEIRLHLRTAIHCCRKEGEPRVSLIRFEPAVHYELCVMPGTPERAHRPPTWLAVFRELPPADSTVEVRQEMQSDPVVQQLENELESTRQHLQTAVEELEGSNEELRSSNEELLSMNEELQSSNEELETSKEELQSLNEELETVNAELQAKIGELDKAHADLLNLFTSNPNPTIFLDRELRVQQFTPATTDVFRLLASDVGRQITDVTFLLEGVDLAEVIARVLETSQSEEFVLSSRVHLQKLYSLTIQPYRSLKGDVEGVVLSFFEITEMEKAKGFAQLQVRRQEELADTGTGALQGEPVDSLVRRSLTGLIDLTQTHLALFLQPTGRPGKLRVLDVAGWDSEIPMETTIELERAGLLRRLIDHEGPLELDMDQAELPAAPWEQEHECRTAMAIALTAANEPHGFLVAYGSGGFTADETDYLASLGHILLNAILHVQAQKLSDLKLEISSLLSQHTTLEEAMPPLARAFGRCWPIQVCELWASDESGRMSCTHFQTPADPGRRKEDRKIFDEITFSPNEGLAGRVFAAKQVAWIPDLAQEPLFERAEEAEALGLKSGLGIPLLHEGQCVGVLTLFSSRWLRPTRRSHQAMEALSLVLGEFKRRVRAETALRQSEAHLYQALQKAPFPLWIVAEDGTFLVQSEAVSAITGYPPEKIGNVGEFDRLTAVEGRELRHLMDAGENIHQGLFKIRTRTGEIRIWDCYASPLGRGPNARRTLITVAYDVTERERNRKELEEVSARKDRFMATLGHELRNPLSAICNSVELLRSSDQNQAHWLAVVGRQSRQMQKLLDSLLDLSRVSSGRIHLQLEHHRLDELVGASVQAASSGHQGERPELVFTPPPEPIWARVDGSRWQQVVDNLITNALKFTPAGGRVEVTVARETSNCILTIKDTGCGILKDQLGRVFEAFHQERPQGLQSGLGLGLPLVKHLVERHGGSIELSSQGRGQGTTATVTLPCCETEPDRPAKQGQKARRVQSTWKALIIEDEPDVCESQAELLRRDGHQVTTAQTVEEALQRFAPPRPEIVLCDLRMQGRSAGFELVKEFKSADSTVPVIAVTGYGLKEDRDRCLEAGFDEHLPKPLTRAKLNELLGKFELWRRARGSRVLLVDDNPIVLTTMRAMLARLGVEVSVAKDTDTAVSQARENRPDLILLDLNLERVTGFDVLKELRSHKDLPRATMVALTGDGDPELRERCLAAGFDLFVTKPFHLWDFLSLFEP